MKDERRLLAVFKSSTDRDLFVDGVAGIGVDGIRAAPLVDEKGAAVACDGPQMLGHARNLIAVHGGTAVEDPREPVGH